MWDDVGIVRDAKKALKLGLLAETRSIGFYQACLDKVSSSASKEQLRHIIEEEKKHHRMLEERLKGLS